MNPSDPRPTISNQQLAYALLRVTLGTNLFLHGVARFLAGHAAFLAYLEKQMQSAPVPAWFLPPFAWALPFFETFVGLFLLAGLFTRSALIVGGLVMLLLQIGTCLAQNWQIAEDQLIYVIIYFILLAFLDRNRWSLDYIFSRREGLDAN